MQSFEEYRKVFLEDTLATEESEANGTVASFVKICTQKLFEGDVMPEYTPCYYQGTGYRNAAVRVDATPMMTTTAHSICFQPFIPALQKMKP